jgi:glucose/mannose-6-phosphate isomerase
MDFYMITHESSLSEFENQILYGLEHFNPQLVPGGAIQNIIICGLGGSGIGGRIARGYFQQIAKVPIEVYSDYFLPAYANTNSLVILSSYSGNTEETMQMFDLAYSKGCKMIAISSGGELFNRMNEKGMAVFTVPKGYQPRMALGFSLSFVLQILGTVCDFDVQTELKKALKIYENKEQYQLHATNLFELINSTAQQPFLIFTDEVLHATSIRFCQQIQENAKGQAYAVVVPECNHNVTETIYGNLNANIIFLNSGTNERINKRFKFIGDLLNKNDNQVLDISVKDGSLSEILKTIYVLDWFSIKLSEAKKADNMSVPNIDKLKIFLAS